jgi:4-alpha-glucanotransferase
MLRSMSALHQLAALYGVQTAYYDARQRRQQTDPESLLATLRLLGAPVATYDDIPAALRTRRQALWQRGVEPVVVAWDGQPAWLTLRLPVSQASGTLACHLQTEAGEVHRWETHPADLPGRRLTAVEGTSYVTKRLCLPGDLPLGYHQLTLETTDRRLQALLLSAPQWAYTFPDEATHKEWGVFLPTYALHSERSWGSGDFSDLEALAAWLAELGGGVIATLPLLSAFLDVPFDWSPYAPASRMFWNEFYIDVTRAPGLEECAAARVLLDSAEIRTALADLRGAPLVDYRRQMALKRRVLEALAHWFFSTGGAQHADFQRFVAATPAVEDYARFRAVGEHQQAPWPAWPAPLRDCVLTPTDYDEQAQRYHLYVQWVAQAQLTRFAERSKAAGVKLYLDLPLGVHADSYDVWRERELFVHDASTGAPPDLFFTQGQNWGFPPLHPEAIRQQGYRYVIAYLRHQLRHIGLLRLDHVMGLHRLFWIPHGTEVRHGVYVHYAAEELYAIMSLESHRHQVCIVGENLGIVPAYVNTTMARHHLHRMYVAQYEIRPAAPVALQPVAAHVVASLNTHDMPPFAAFWQGLDIADQVALGFLSQEDAYHEQQQRQVHTETLPAFLRQQGWLTDTDPEGVVRAFLAFLSASPAQIVLVNLEDLWLETQPQNVPGTYNERPNWQRKAHYSLETLRQMPQVLTTLHTVNARRKQRTEPV